MGFPPRPAASSARGTQSLPAAIRNAAEARDQATLAQRGITVQQPQHGTDAGMARIGAIQADEWVAKAGRRLIEAYRAAIA